MIEESHELVPLSYSIYKSISGFFGRQNLRHCLFIPSLEFVKELLDQISPIYQELVRLQFPFAGFVLYTI